MLSRIQAAFYCLHSSLLVFSEKVQGGRDTIHILMPLDIRSFMGKEDFIEH